MRPLPPLGAVGPGVTVHVVPSHVSTSARDGLDVSPAEPTAMQLVGLLHDTPLNDVWYVPRFGLGITAQELPFQDSTRVELTPEAFTTRPTATQAVACGQVMPSR